MLWKKEDKGHFADLTADGVNPSPKRAATAVHVSEEGLRLAEEIASSSMRRSRSAVHWYGMIGMGFGWVEGRGGRGETLLQAGVEEMWREEKKDKNERNLGQL